MSRIKGFEAKPFTRPVWSWTGGPLVVTGGRDYDNIDRVYNLLDQLHAHAPITLLCHGACGWDAGQNQNPLDGLQGADGLADYWVRDRQVPFLRFPADWTRYGNPAGPKRNKLMMHDVFTFHAGRHLVAFPGRRGTKNAVSCADKLGFFVLEVDPS